MNSQNKKSKVKNLILTLGLSFGMVIVSFLLFGLFNKAEAAGSEFVISTATEGSRGNSTVTADSSNRFYVAWEDDRLQSDIFHIFGCVINSDGNFLTHDTESVDVNIVPAKSCFRPYLIANNGGNVLLAWRDDRLQATDNQINVQGRLFNYDASTGTQTDLGKAQKGPIGDSDKDFRLNDDLGTYTCDYPSITTNGTNFAIAYYDRATGAISEGNDGTSAKLAFVNSAAYPLDKKTAIAGDLQSYNTTQTAVCENPSDNGGWKRAVAWDGNNKVHIQLYNSSGVKIQNGFKEYTCPDASPFVSIAANDSGQLGIAWEGNTYTYFAAYNNGQFTNPGEISNRTTGHITSRPKVFNNGDKFGVIYGTQFDGGGGVRKSPRLTAASVELAGNKVQVEGRVVVIGAYSKDNDNKEFSGWDSNYIDYSVIPLAKTTGQIMHFGLQWGRQAESGYFYIRGAQCALVDYDKENVKLKKATLVNADSGVNYTQPQVAQITPSQYALTYKKVSGSTTTVKVKTFNDSTFESGKSESFNPNEQTIEFGGYNQKVATDNNGNVTVAYENQKKIYAKRFDSNLKALGSAVRVDEITDNNGAGSASVAALADGNFLVAFKGYENGKFQTEHSLIKPYSSSLTSSTFRPASSAQQSLNPFVNTAYAADAAVENANGVEWGQITWEVKNSGDDSSVIVSVSTDEGGHFLAMSNGENISSKIKSSGIDMPSISETIKYKITASSTSLNQSPSLNWIQIGYGPGTSEYDYFIRVAPATSNVVVKTTQEVTVQVTRKEKQSEAQPVSLNIIPKAYAQAVSDSEGEPLANQDVTATISSGGFGKLSQKETSAPSATPTGGATGTVQGDTDTATGGSTLSDQKPLTGKTDANGEFTFNYTAPVTANLSDSITVATIPSGKDTISAEAVMTAVYPVNAVFQSKPVYVGNKKPVTFVAAITNHMTESFKGITSDVTLNKNLQYIADSAKINGSTDNVRVVMQDGVTSFEYITPGSSALGNESPVLKPGQSINLEFQATAEITESTDALGQTNLYTADLTLKYQNAKGNQLTNDPVRAEGTVASIWLQTLYGDIYSQNGFAADVVPPSGSENATYLIQTDGTISHFTTKAGDKYQIENYVQGILSPVNIKRLMRDQVDGILADPTKYNVRKITAGLHTISELDRGEKEVVYVNGDLVLTGPGEFKSPLTIIVKGNLVIKNNTSYDNTPVSAIKKLPSLGFIVLGDTQINAKVTRGVGAIYTEGNFATGDSANQLVWEGLWVASHFDLQRTYFYTGTTLEAAEKVIYDGRVFANTPTGFGQLTDYPKWKEVSPQ